ncbi:MAG TPA: hypothetical protein VFI63_03515 [Solirubrobacterales bacterium]|nr:hypothetical protein [Solirubrobacterales bacterium]
MPLLQSSDGLRRWRLALIVLAAVAAIAMAAPRRAAAGEFTIDSCQADAGNFASGAFEDFATRGMRWRRACDPLGPGLRGLVVGNVVRGGTVVRGAQSAFVLAAPPGTAFSRLRWSGQAHRRDCRYALQLYAEHPGASPVSIKNVPADRHCPRNSAQASSWPRLRTYDLGGATRIIQRVVCVGSSSARYCSSRGLNYIETFSAEATVADAAPPSVSILPDGPLARGEWVSGIQSLGYEADDNVGVKSAQAWSGGASRGGDQRECDFAQRIPCPNGPGRIEVDTRKMPEGTQQMQVAAEDAAGNSAGSAPVAVRIDNTPPGAVAVGVEGGEGWRNRNGFDLAWENAPEGDRAPITAALYRICRAGSSECTSGSQAGTSISRIEGLAVPSPGEWELRLWREDAAGNQQPTNASLPVKLLFDPEPPELGFEDPSAADPTRISVLVTDRISGLGGGQIEVSRAGSGVWQLLPTSAEGSHLVAHVDDASMPAGEYELRATAHDKANNEASTYRRLDGQPMRLTLPLRADASLQAGMVEKRSVSRSVRHGSKRHKARRTKTVLEPHAQVDFGRHVRLAGRLLDHAGNPLTGAPVEVFSRPREGPEGMVGTLTTNAQGRFAYALDALASQTLRFAYPGTATRLPAEGTVILLVAGHSTFAVSRSHLLNGQSVLFSGDVQGRPLPATGKLVELQVLLSRGWQTFRTARSEPDGHWRIPYRFKRTCGLARYRFRARLPAEAGYPLDAGTSPELAVQVRGRPCSGGG